MSNKTIFLFYNPGLLNGVARLYDFTGSFDSYNESATPKQADAVALYADWAAVGDELVIAMNKLAAGELVQET